MRLLNGNWRERRKQHIDTLLTINYDICHSCGACVAVCPPDALFLRGYELTVEQDACTACERCIKLCPVHALSLVPRMPDESSL